MVDMAMCMDKNCPKRYNCYRYNAKAEKYQVYFSKSPRTKGTELCDEYVPMAKENKTR